MPIYITVKILMSICILAHFTNVNYCREHSTQNLKIVSMFEIHIKKSNLLHFRFIRIIHISIKPSSKKTKMNLNIYNDDYGDDDDNAGDDDDDNDYVDDDSFLSIISNRM